MSKHRFRVFYRIFGGATDSREVIEATPDKASRALREQFAGKAVHIVKIKHIEEITNEPVNAN